MLMEWLQVIGMIIGVLGLFWLFVVFFGAYADGIGASASGPSVIQGWAGSNGYEVRALEMKRGFQDSPIFRHPAMLKSSFGPHTGQASISDVVYRVVVTKIGEEKRRVAWIRLGAELTVVWEDEMQDPPIEGF